VAIAFFRHWRTIILCQSVAEKLPESSLKSPQVPPVPGTDGPKSESGAKDILAFVRVRRYGPIVSGGLSEPDSLTLPDPRSYHDRAQNELLGSLWFTGDTMRTILLIILVLLLLGALPTWPYSASWGYFPSGGLGLVLLIVIILAITGRL
jgi:Protein of unknown function (DUF3309)